MTRKISPNHLQSPRSLMFTAWCLLLATGMIGCTSEPAGPETHPVTGTVTYQGKPADDVTLTFHAEGNGVHALAVTDETGAFDVSTYFDMGRREQRGMVAGNYRVTAAKLDVEAIKSTLQPPKNLLPEKYNSPELSALTANVIPGAENRFEFELN